MHSVIWSALQSPTSHSPRAMHAARAVTSTSRHSSGPPNRGPFPLFSCPALQPPQRTSWSLHTLSTKMYSHRPRKRRRSSLRLASVELVASTIATCASSACRRKGCASDQAGTAMLESWFHSAVHTHWNTHTTHRRHPPSPISQTSTAQYKRTSLQPCLHVIQRLQQCTLACLLPLLVSGVEEIRILKLATSALLAAVLPDIEMACRMPQPAARPGSHDAGIWTRLQ